jgi:Mlc titration factor MtfA (ptsG expression regulator)
VRTILIYPSGFQMTDEGWQEEGWTGFPVDGQAVHRGPVILSWDAVLSEGRDPSRGSNIVTPPRKSLVSRSVQL